MWTLGNIDLGHIYLTKRKGILSTLDIPLPSFGHHYLTIIPQARMDSESMAHEAEGRMDY